MRDSPQPLAVPDTINETWSMDFTHDQLQCGRSYRLLNILDNCNREGLAAEVDFAPPSQRVIRCLEPLIEWRGAPKRIRLYYDPEYISGALAEWAEKRQTELAYNRPGSPQQNAYVERFTRTVRYDWLKQHLFETLEEVQQHATKWNCYFAARDEFTSFL